MNAPTLQTERLLLRPLKKEDARNIFLLRSDEFINQYIDRPRATSIEDAKAFIEKIGGLTAEQNAFYRAITLKENDDLIGTVTLWNVNDALNKAEIGYELLPSFQGKGYMQEALKAVIDLAFNELNLSSIEGWTHPHNISSYKLLEKLGFTRDLDAEKTKPDEAKEIIYSLKR